MATFLRYPSPRREAKSREEKYPAMTCVSKMSFGGSQSLARERTYTEQCPGDDHDRRKRATI